MTPQEKANYDTHETRYSDSSVMDEVCMKCGAHDEVPGGFGGLILPCPNETEEHRLARERISRMTLTPSASYFIDVGRFHQKFGLVVASSCAAKLATEQVRHAEKLPEPPEFTGPNQLTDDVAAFRLGFLLEELGEVMEAMGYLAPARTLKVLAKSLRSYTGELRVGPTDLAKTADGLADLTYVALGTAHMMGLPFDEVWVEVQRANMAKERASSATDPRSTRGHRLDVVKPESWKAPDHWPAIEAAWQLAKDLGVRLR